MTIARLTTVRMSLSLLINGQADYFRDKGNTYFLASGPCAHSILDKFYTELPLVRRPHVFKDIKALIATYNWLRKIKPDILHTHTPKAGLIGMIAGFFAGVPVRVHTVAGIPWMESSGLSRLFYKAFEYLTYSFATKIYPNSHGLHSFLMKELPFAINKYKVIGNGSSNGIDVDYFSSDSIIETKELLRNRYKISLDSFVWLYIGRIVKDKGIDELVQVFLKMGNNHKLLLVGSFEDDQDPISQKTKNIIKNNSNIILMGFQKDVRPFIKLSDSLVFPSYREGFPNVPMQAAAMNLPQIATNINGCNEIVIPQVSGILVPPKDIHALFTAMKQMSEDYEFRKKIILSSRSTIVNRYSRKEILKLLEQEYYELLINNKKNDRFNN